MSNLISAAVNQADITAAHTKIVELRDQLSFLIALSNEQKKNRSVMGQKSVEFVNLAVRGVNNFQRYMPQSMNAEEFKNDVTLISYLWELRVPLAALLESLDDTLFAASADAMKSANEVYEYLRGAARRDESVKSLVEEMKKRYERKPSAKAKRNSTPAGTSADR